jgi:non-ribosomal peptide synthetase component E (peptide arylation enzyme)
MVIPLTGKYLSITEGVHIQHARNGGEKEIGPYKVDGYYENENGQKYVLEFNGKFYRCLRVRRQTSSPKTVV